MNLTARAYMTSPSGTDTAIPYGAGRVPIAPVKRVWAARRSSGWRVVGEAKGPSLGILSALLFLAYIATLPDYHADQDKRGEAIASAIRESGVRHVVALSSVGGELASGNGFIASLHRQERRLRALEGVNVMFLRPGAFFEGFYAALETIRHEGVVADSVAPEAKVPMIATADIAAVAAAALQESNWSGIVVRELLGPRDLTYTEVAAAIGEAIGQADLQYVQLPDEELVAILTEAAGFSPDFAALFVEFNQALSEGRLHSLEGRNESNTTPTEFDEFAAELAHAYAAAE